MATRRHPLRARRTGTPRRRVGRRAVIWGAPIDAKIVDWRAPIDPSGRYTRVAHVCAPSRSAPAPLVAAFAVLFMCGVALLLPQVAPAAVFDRSALLAGPAGRVASVPGGEEFSGRPSADALSAATGSRFMTIDTGRARLIAEASLPPDSLTELAAAVDRDVAQLERRIGHRFAYVPYVYAAASRSSFTAALAGPFGRADSDLTAFAASGGVYVPSHEAVVVNWENVAGARPIKIVRHELAHLLIRQIVGSAVIPVWVEEGLASLEEQELGESLRDRYVARSLVMDGKMSLASLSSSAGWSAGSAHHGGAHYEVAAEAARLLRAEFPGPSLVHLLEETERVGSFARAYESIAGRPLAEFIARFPGRLARDLPAYRLDVAPGLRSGAVWTLLGFPPQQTVSVLIEGPLYRAAFDVSIDEHGVYSAAFGATAPAGTYWFSARSGSQTVRGVIAN